MDVEKYIYCQHCSFKALLRDDGLFSYRQDIYYDKLLHNICFGCHGVAVLSDLVIEEQVVAFKMDWIEDLRFNVFLIDSISYAAQTCKVWLLSDN